MDHELPPELGARNSSPRSRSDMLKQDGLRYHVPVSQTHNLDLNNFLRGQRSLDRFRPQPAGSTTVQYDHQVSMDGRFQRLVTSYARCSELEFQSRSAKKHWNELLSQYQQGQLRYEVAVDPYKDDSTSSAHPSEISTLRKRLMDNSTALEAHFTIVRNIEREYREARTALDLEFNHLRLIVPSNPQSITSNSAYSNTTYATKPDRRPSWETSASSMPDPTQNHMPDLEALREDYFKWAADVNIYGEQLADHNYDYWASLGDRERRQDQDETLSVTDEDFEADAQRRREIITKALDEAIEKADRLKAECKSLGIDLNPQRRSIWDLEDAALSEAETEARAEYRKTFEAALAHVPPEAFKNAELVLASASDHGSEGLEYPASSERIENWVENLSPDGDTDERIERPMLSDHA
jgi:hypothetical protein